MAPEVFRHEPYNNKVDVYSFGMILYQLIEGVVPYNGTKVNGWGWWWRCECDGGRRCDKCDASQSQNSTT